MTDEENLKSFLSGLEDSSAGRSDDDDSVFVFLANYATELWYRQIRGRDTSYQQS